MVCPRPAFERRPFCSATPKPKPQKKTNKHKPSRVSQAHQNFIPPPSLASASGVQVPPPFRFSLPPFNVSWRMDIICVNIRFFDTLLFPFLTLFVEAYSTLPSSFPLLTFNNVSFLKAASAVQFLCGLLFARFFFQRFPSCGTSLIFDFPAVVESGRTLLLLSMSPPNATSSHQNVLLHILVQHAPPPTPCD